MTSIGPLGRMEADSAALRLRLDVLTRQVSTGRKTDRLGELAPQLPRALTLRAELGRRETYGTAVGEALGRTAATAGVLQRLSAIASEFGDGVAMKLDPGDTASFSLVATRARAALVEVGQLLNSQSGGRRRVTVIGQRGPDRAVERHAVRDIDRRHPVVLLDKRRRRRDCGAI